MAVGEPGKPMTQCENLSYDAGNAGVSKHVYTLTHIKVLIALIQGIATSSLLFCILFLFLFYFYLYFSFLLFFQ